jgi:hypothetical protein
MEAGSGHEDSSHNILTLDALQVLSRSQVTPGLSMSMRIRPICKIIHTCTYVRSAITQCSHDRWYRRMMSTDVTACLYGRIRCWSG